MQAVFDLPAWGVLGDHRHDPDPARAQEKAADRLRAKLERERRALLPAVRPAPLPPDYRHRHSRPAGAALSARAALPVRHPVSTPMLWRWATGSRVERIYVPLSRIAPSLPLTVIVAEDGSFCRNRGVDLGAIREALQQADDDLRKRAAAPPSPNRRRRTCSCGRAAASSARRWKFRWRCGSIWCCRSGGFSKSISTLPNGARTASSAPRPAPAGLSANRPAISRRAEAAELAAILPNPVHRSARMPSLQLRRLAGLYERRAAAHPALDACVRPLAPTAEARFDSACGYP